MKTVSSWSDDPTDQIYMWVNEWVSEGKGLTLHWTTSQSYYDKGNDSQKASKRPHAYIILEQANQSVQSPQCQILYAVNTCPYPWAFTSIAFVGTSKTHSDYAAVTRVDRGEMSHKSSLSGCLQQIGPGKEEGLSGNCTLRVSLVMHRRATANQDSWKARLCLRDRS